MDVIRPAEALGTEVRSIDICEFDESEMEGHDGGCNQTDKLLQTREVLDKVVPEPRPRSPGVEYSAPRVKPAVRPPPTRTPPAAPIPLSVKAASPFSPSSWDCSTCHERNPFSNTHCHGPACGAPFNWSNAIISSRGDRLDPARFPVHWICGACSRHHLVVFIISGWSDEFCVCGQPTLQAVYDQFGDLFLYWPDDAAVKDLRNRRKAEEAARRLWLAGGDRWTVFSTFGSNLPKIHLGEKQGKGKELVTALTGPRVMC